MKMKTIATSFAALFLVAATTFAGNGINEKRAHEVNAEKSALFWTARKVTGMHTGRLALKSGSLEVLNGVPVSATMVMDMTTIDVTDLQGEMKERLIGHLHSDDFFHTEKHPEAVFKSTGFTPIANAQNRDPNYMVKGILTMKDISHEIDFPVFVAVRDNGVVANGKLTFDRSLWSIKFGSSSFFEGLGDNIIYDDVDVNFVLSTK